MKGPPSTPQDVVFEKIILAWLQRNNCECHGTIQGKVNIKRKEKK